MQCRYVPAGVKRALSGSAGMWRSERRQAVNLAGPNFDTDQDISARGTFAPTVRPALRPVAVPEGGMTSCIIIQHEG
jgi:hypothetical protein